MSPGLAPCPLPYCMSPSPLSPPSSSSLPCPCDTWPWSWHRLNICMCPNSQFISKEGFICLSGTKKASNWHISIWNCLSRTLLCYVFYYLYWYSLNLCTNIQPSSAATENLQIFLKFSTAPLCGARAGCCSDIGLICPESELGPALASAWLVHVPCSLFPPPSHSTRHNCPNFSKSCNVLLMKRFVKH